MKQKMEEDLEDDLANEHYYYNQGTPGSINCILFIYISKRNKREKRFADLRGETERERNGRY